MGGLIPPVWERRERGKRGEMGVGGGARDREREKKKKIEVLVEAEVKKKEGADLKRPEQGGRFNKQKR